MDSILFLAGCVGFAWLVVWSLRDFARPSAQFWPFDARWMRRPEADAEAARDGDAPAASGWRARAAAAKRPGPAPAASSSRRASAGWRGRT